MIQQIDGISFEMGKWYDFSFLRKYGHVFKVFDDQDSGNICFGVQDELGIRTFIKYAGAVTKRCSVMPEIAVRNLKSTVSTYQELSHSTLIHLRDTIETDDAGFGIIFDWEDGHCMGRMYPEAHEKFMSLPQDDHLKVYHDLLSFTDYTARVGYVAIDFYDGSVMYDPIRHKTTVCDIDFFRKQPAVNDMGRMWGSSRFMSPEEFEHGAALDEITNVYTMGAFAFALFGRYSRELCDWKLSEDAYRVAIKATTTDRSRRQQSISQLIQEWENAL